MNKQEFIVLLEGVVEAEPGTITGNETIESIPGWDSLAIVSFIAMIDESLGITLSPKKIADAKSVDDLVALIGDNII
ncbi:MAG: acyl carrier protein [Candidatus Electronema aureum]|uniref:Acyl carrier protein n=1 Tax=Candidatus Electronema aureum TaxID=2005002 RepID=A0A521FZT3_9BACT|nr:MAG: acyl carrier protein [Candidatus Electronema aureum]